MIAIIDYGVGNIASIHNMLRKIGVDSVLTSNVDEIKNADRLILPGVGAFDACAIKLRSSGLLDILDDTAHHARKPILGICVGLQLLFEGSEEGKEPGLNWVKGKVVRFQPSRMKETLKIPHMGWSDVEARQTHPLAEGLQQESRFYFVHSYHAQVNDENDILFAAEYGYTFPAAVCHHHIAGVQFHPEKSHRFGMQLLSNFAQWQPSVEYV